MTAKAKIEGLTNAWYGFALVSTLVSLAAGSWGIFSIVWHALGLMIGFVVTFFLGRALVNKSSVTRFFLLIVSAVMTVLGVLGVGRMGWAFLQSWSVSYLVAAAWASAGVYMYGRSYKTLTDSSVKAYFG